jgi:hypothetical protein
MRSGVSRTILRETACQEFLFTWKPQYWPYRLLRGLIEAYRSTGSASVSWRCAAHKKIGRGDSAYMLKQGKPIGIFGRGTVIGEPERVPEAAPGERSWQVKIEFDASRGDVLWDPHERFLVQENQLLTLHVPKTQWQNQSSGITLDPDAARAIDDIVFDSVMIGGGRATEVDEAVQEVARQKKMVEQAMRPEQQDFSRRIREIYRGKCAVTGCVTHAALEAAHIRTQRGLDNNSPANGILLRSDIHALFDRLLVTLSEDGGRLEVSPELTDTGYNFLKTAFVTRPGEGSRPSVENIRDHRGRFLERLQRLGGSQGE